MPFFVFTHTKKNEIGLYKLKLVLDMEASQNTEILVNWSCCAALCVFRFFSHSYVMFMYDLWLYAGRPMPSERAREWNKKKNSFQMLRRRCIFVDRLLFENFIAPFPLYHFLFFTHIVLHGSDCDMYIHGYMGHGMAWYLVRVSV